MRYNDDGLFLHNQGIERTETVIPNEAMEMLLEDTKNFLILSYLFRITNEKYECEIDYKKIGEITKLERKAIHRRIKKLINNGYFEIIKKGNRANLTILKNLYYEKINKQIYKKIRE